MRNETLGRERLVGDVYVDRRTAFLIRSGTVGVLVGVVVGLATFMAGHEDLMPAGDHRVALAAVALAGVYAHLLTSGLRESVAAAGVAFGVGAAVCIGAWLWPVYTLGYTGALAELVGAPRLRDAVVDVLTIQLLVFGGGYLAAVTYEGVTE